MLGILLIVTGCGSTAGTPHSAQRDEWDVAADPKATAADVIEAGRVAGVDLNTDGSRQLTTYIVQSDDDELPQRGAWRLTDRDGKKLAQGVLPQVTEMGAHAFPRALPDGFLLTPYREPTHLHVANDGTVTPFVQTKSVVQPRPGDLVDFFEPQSVLLRPSDLTIHPLPRKARGQQSVEIAPDGTLWVLRDSGNDPALRVVHRRPGSDTWVTDRIPNPEKGWPVTGLGVGDGRVTLMLPDASPTLWQRSTTPPKSPWNQSELQLSLGDEGEPFAQPLSDGALAITDEMEDGLWVQDADGTVREITTPGQADRRRVSVQGDRIFAVDLDRVWVSEDHARTWQKLPS